MLKIIELMRQPPTYIPANLQGTEIYLDDNATQYDLYCLSMLVELLRVTMTGETDNAKLYSK